MNKLNFLKEVPLYMPSIGGSDSKNGPSDDDGYVKIKRRDYETLVNLVKMFQDILERR